MLMSQQTVNVPLMTDMTPSPLVSESFRSLRTNTQYALKDSGARLIAVTSSRQGEGRSTTAANLAAAFALEGKRTLLIDADMRRPVQHETFGVSNRLGLAQLLAESDAIVTYTIPTKIEQLTLLPSGQIPFNPSELLASKRMDDLLLAAKEAYDMVILDTPPVLEVTDAQIIAAKSDGILLVVGSGKVKRNEAMKAKGLLEHVKANILGVVLNGGEAH